MGDEDEGAYLQRCIAACTASVECVGVLDHAQSEMSTASAGRHCVLHTASSAFYQPAAGTLIRRSPPPVSPSVRYATLSATVSPKMAGANLASGLVNAEDMDTEDLEAEDEAIDPIWAAHMDTLPPWSIDVNVRVDPAGGGERLAGPAWLAIGMAIGLLFGLLLVALAIARVVCARKACANKAARTTDECSVESK